MIWIILACAEKRLFHRPQRVGGVDHPRLCGEKYGETITVDYTVGSPPPTRGKARAVPAKYPRLRGEKFADEHGKPIHPDTFTKHLRKIYDRAGLSRDYHLHTWRHFFVTSLLHGGVDKQTVADLAGHGDTSFLERTYCHPQMEKRLEASECLSTQVFGPVTYSEESDNPLTA